MTGVGHGCPVSSGANTLTDERWIIVPGFPGYRVSDAGRVQTRKVMAGPNRRDVLGPMWRDLKPKRHKQGHRSVTLRHDGMARQRYVHQLVLELFVGPCPPGLECCHEDDDPNNNRLTNLRWDTHASNAKDASRNGRWHGKPGMKGERNPHCKITDAACEEIRRDKAAGVRVSVLAGRHGISVTHVFRICSGECRS